MGRCLKWVAVVPFVALVATSSSGAGLALRHSTSQTDWTDQDIGNPAISGSANATPSGFTIIAGGSDISGRSDQFNFEYQQVNGDVDVRARVDSLAYVSAWSKAGVMIRGSLAPSSANALALVSAGHGTAFQSRTQSGASTTRTMGTNVTAPVWVRLVRLGNSVTSYTSADGVTWTSLGSATVQLPSVAYVGLAVTSRSASTATTASFSQINVQPLALPAGQLDADVGGPAIAGAGDYVNGTYYIHAGGTDIGGTSDQFNYVYQPAGGDLDVSVRIDSMTNASSGAKAGVMIRETLDAGSPDAFALVSPGTGLAFQRRPVAGGTSVSTSGASGAVPVWLRLTRTGALFTAYRSTDGSTWNVIGSDSITMADPVYVGIAATSRNTSSAINVSADTLSIHNSANQPPVVSITSPASGATFTAPATVAITASATDPQNQLTMVQFFNGTALLGTAMAAPYAFTWSSVPAGTYSLTAVASDAASLSTASAAVSVTVAAPLSPPTSVDFTASTDNATVTSYEIDIFAAGVDTTTATPVASINVGHPTPAATNTITISAPAFFAALAPGNYQLTVSALSPSGVGRSTPPVAFTR
jgi:regulation of enolase protein 1 (concanavalin A-like superfamily)